MTWIVLVLLSSEGKGRGFAIIMVFGKTSFRLLDRGVSFSLFAKFNGVSSPSSP